MTRRDWWIGIVVLLLALSSYSVWPRYEWRSTNGQALIRIDRWFGTAEIGRWNDGEWQPDRISIAQRRQSEDKTEKALREANERADRSLLELRRARDEALEQSAGGRAR